MFNNLEVLFIHIEKCAGSSLKKILYEYYLNIYDKQEIYNSSLNGDINLCTDDDCILLNDKNYKIILAHCSYNKDFFANLIDNKCFTIVCVRNPIHRILSHYYYFDYKNTKKKFYELNDLLKKELIKEYGKLLQLRLANNDLNYEISKKNIDNINCILIFENIDEDLKTLNIFLNKKYNLDVKIINEKINNNSIKSYDNDFKYINDNIDLIIDMKIYNYIINLDVSKRFKIL